MYKNESERVSKLIHTDSNHDFLRNVQNYECKISFYKNERQKLIPNHDFLRNECKISFYKNEFFQIKVEEEK